MVTDCVDQGTCSGQFQDYDAFNPYLPGKVSRTGYNFLYEPLYFYNAYRDEIIPWIATGHEYNSDYTEVTIKIRPGVEWSDGQPWTAHDVVFTINMLRDHAPELTFAVDMQTWVKTAVASDSLTAHIALTAPNPRFVFTYFTHNFDNGVPIVPRHIWEGQDPKTFANFDLAQGWPVVSGPYRLAHSVPEQRIWDRREGWWATKIGFRQPPQVERLIYLPYMEEAKQVQNLATNAMDLCADMLPPNIRTTLEQNPNVTTWSGQEPPYGYLDWWPLSLGFNAQESPYDEPAFRWAVNHAINREQLVEVGWQGAGRTNPVAVPRLPSAQALHVPSPRLAGTISGGAVRSGPQRGSDAGVWVAAGRRGHLDAEWDTGQSAARHQPNFPRHRADLSRAVAAGWLCSQHAHDLGQLQRG